MPHPLFEDTAVAVIPEKEAPENYMVTWYCQGCLECGGGTNHSSEKQRAADHEAETGHKVVMGFLRWLE